MPPSPGLRLHLVKGNRGENGGYLSLFLYCLSRHTRALKPRHDGYADNGVLLHLLHTASYRIVQHGFRFEGRARRRRSRSRLPQSTRRCSYTVVRRLFLVRLRKDRGKNRPAFTRLFRGVSLHLGDTASGDSSGPPITSLFIGPGSPVRHHASFRPPEERGSPEAYLYASRGVISVVERRKAGSDGDYPTTRWTTLSRAF